MDRITGFRIFLALLFRLFSWRVRYVTLSPRLKSERFSDFLNIFGIGLFDWQDQTGVDSFAPLFPQAPDLHRKIRVILFNRMKSFTMQIASYLYLLDKLAVEEPDRVLAVSAHPLVRIYLKQNGNVIPSLYPFWLALIIHAVSLVARAIRFVVSLLLAILRKKFLAPAAHPAAESGSQPDPGGYEVLFFPHQGIYYSDLYMKDHYYAADPASPFNRNNILHVEIHGDATSALLSRIETDYRKHGLHYYMFRFPAKKYVKFFKTFFAFAARSQSGIRRSSGKDWAGLVYLSLAYAVVGKYNDLAARFTRAKIALAGYDYLFPPALSLALQARGIKTAASQERFIQAFYPGTTMIFDAYFAVSRKAAGALTAQPYCAIDSFSPIGPIRGDQFEFRTLADHRTSSLRRSSVLVYDFHSPDNRIENAQTIMNNWRNNKAFYKEIIRLALEFPQARFTIRGKFDSWTRLPVFRDVHDMIVWLPNLDISHDYQTLNESYRLARSADLVIAKHTSICDECLAAGIPVLIHDYAENLDRCVASVYDYDNAPFFVFSFEDLHAAVRRFLDQGEYLDEAYLKRFREEFYDGPADGHVLDRLSSALAWLYQSACTGASATKSGRGDPQEQMTCAS